mmetsp:Transcript_13663/g.57436  ORF Transcript_13663/g.57436 Transcript_13663/m.57436 type:complete len:334 (+) Transcript_13663:230-1231(+)
MDLDRGRSIVVPRGVRAARRAPDKRGGPRHVLAHASLRRRRREFREFFAPRATEPILPVPVSARKRREKKTKRDQPRRLFFFFGSALVARGRHDCPQLHLYVARRVRPGSRRGVRRGRDFPDADAFGRRRRGAERLGGRVRREKAAFAIGGGDVPRPIRGQDLRRERVFGVSGEGRHTALARGLDGHARRCVDRGRVGTKGKSAGVALGLVGAVLCGDARRSIRRRRREKRRKRKDSKTQTRGRRASRARRSADAPRAPRQVHDRDAVRAVRRRHRARRVRLAVRGGYAVRVPRRGRRHVRFGGVVLFKKRRLRATRTERLVARYAAARSGYA